MKIIKDSFAAANLPMPTIENRDGGVLVTIKRSPLFEKLYRGDTQNDTQNEPQNEPQSLSARHEAMVSLMREDIHISRTDLSKRLNVSLATIKRDIASLRDKHVIVYVGSSKNGHWEVLI